MPLSDLLGQRIQRLVPHEGLVVDVNTWSVAHNYHMEHQKLHSMAMHSPGVVTGLEVVSWDPPDNSVVINPGVAIDVDGHTIIVGEPQRFRLQTNEAATLYLVLQYREVPGGVGAAGDDGSQARYLLEAYMLQVMRELPTGPYVELARVQASGSEDVVRDPSDPFHPNANEIDTRFRMISGSRPLSNINIGVVPLEMTQDGQITHAEGALNLARTINNTTRYRAEFAGSINLSQEINDCELLLISGRNEFQMAAQWVENIRNFLDRGGVLLGQSNMEGVGGNGQIPPFRNAFVELTRQLGRTLRNVERTDHVLGSFYLFAQPPEGLNGQAMMAIDEGVVYSDASYGTLWEGGEPDRPATREQIRSALELGVNVAVYASNRTRMRSARLVSS